MAMIEFECPYCQRLSKVPLSFAGRQGKCPGCLELLEVPDPAAAAKAQDGAPADEGAGAPAGGELTGEAQQPCEASPRDEQSAPCTPAPRLAKNVFATAPAVVSPETTDSDGPRAQKIDRACPYCGETIKRIAKKCRYCGEFIDKQLARTRRRGLGRLPLASPGSRLGAWAIDLIMFHLPTWTPLVVGIQVLDRTSSTQGKAVGWSLIALACIVGTFITSYNWYLITVRGQTIGKRWLKIKVVHETGKPVTFVTGVLLRNWITGVLGSLVLSWIGCLFFIIDSCMIFCQERRCLHDHIASTRVIEVKPRVRRGPKTGARSA